MAEPEQKVEEVKTEKKEEEKTDVTNEEDSDHEPAKYA